MKIISINYFYSTLYYELGILKGFETPSNNQIISRFEKGSIFTSYDTLIGVKVGEKDLFLTKYHDYSKTTSKYCKIWCGLTTKERRKGLQEGTIFLLDL